jgi:hypothetical protein
MRVLCEIFFIFHLIQMLRLYHIPPSVTHSQGCSLICSPVSSKSSLYLPPLGANKLCLSRLYLLRKSLFHLPCRARCPLLGVKPCVARRRSRSSRRIFACTSSSSSTTSEVPPVAWPCCRGARPTGGGGIPGGGAGAKVPPPPPSVLGPAVGGLRDVGGGPGLEGGEYGGRTLPRPT